MENNSYSGAAIVYFLFVLFCFLCTYLPSNAVLPHFLSLTWQWRRWPSFQLLLSSPANWGQTSDAFRAYWETSFRFHGESMHLISIALVCRKKRYWFRMGSIWLKNSVVCAHPVSQIGSVLLDQFSWTPITPEQHLQNCTSGLAFLDSFTDRPGISMEYRCNKCQWACPTFTANVSLIQ